MVKFFTKLITPRHLAFNDCLAKISVLQGQSCIYDGQIPHPQIKLMFQFGGYVKWDILIFFFSSSQLAQCYLKTD